MYSPSRYFMKQLKDLDPKLGCFYNKNIHKFIITFQRVTGEPVPIMQVKTEDDGFRFPDNRDIIKLHESDTQRVPMHERLNIVSKYMYDYREKKRAESKENLRLMTIDDKKQLRKAVGRLHSPKFDSSIFRKIKNKPKGKVF